MEQQELLTVLCWKPCTVIQVVGLLQVRNSPTRVVLEELWVNQYWKLVGRTMSQSILEALYNGATGRRTLSQIPSSYL